MEYYKVEITEGGNLSIVDAENNLMSINHIVEIANTSTQLAVENANIIKKLRGCVELIKKQGGTDVIVNGRMQNIIDITLKEINNTTNE